MLLEIRDGTISRSGNVILSHIDFAIRGTEKIALVGRNGAGKTTLLDVLAGRRQLDANEKNPESGLYTSRAVTIGMLSQLAVDEPDETVEEYIKRAVGEAGEKKKEDGCRKQEEKKAGEGVPITADPLLSVRYDRLFTGFGFALSDKTKKLCAFSGGEQVKIMLIRLLIEQPDILLLDEPTNHLDLESVQWLEQYLKKYPGAVVAASHDRYFIDEFADVVYDITGGRLVRYAGNYTQYRKEKTKRFEKDEKAWEAQQEEIARLNGLIAKFKNKARKASFARSRESILKRMEEMPKPVPDEAVIHTEEILPEHAGSRWVFTCKDLQAGYNAPIRELTFRLRRGQKVGIIGPNGAGKTTLLRTIAGLLPPLKGELQIGEHIDAAYLDQLTAGVLSDKNVITWFHDAFPAMTLGDVRKVLAGYLFYGADMGKKVSSLSGGEKTRLMLAAILQRRPNFLLLDEPTNNMDIPAKETLESIFKEYRGTILFISHDRYFLSEVADALLILEPGTTAVDYYPSDYRHFSERKKRLQENGGADITRSAENQALIETMRAVPKKESGMLKTISDEEQAFDWRFDLNREPRQRAEEAFKEAAEEMDRVPDTEEAYREKAEALPELKESLESARNAWTRSLLDWYDIWDEREEYRRAKRRGEKEDEES